jgi:glycosyltransferase involved in cell wall biosynthesis
MRVLRVYHSAVVDEYRQRERLLIERHGHDVHLVMPPAWREGGQLVKAPVASDVPIHVIDVRGRPHPNLFWYDPSALRKLMRDLRPGIVDLQEEPYSLAVASALRDLARTVPQAKVCVYSAQNLPKRYPPPFSWLEHRALNRAMAAYPCSTEAGERLRASGFRGSLHVMPLGVTVVQRPQRASGMPRVGFVGRLEPYKGPMLALRAFAQATAELSASFEVIGSGSEDQALRQYVVETQIGDRVQFAGSLPQSEALARIGDLDILLIPSLTTLKWKEQFGRVAAQAMAAGTAVIASDSGSLREVVKDGGVLVREGDVEGLAEALRKLLVNPNTRMQVASRGYERAKLCLSWECVTDRVDEMYRGLIGAETL